MPNVPTHIRSGEVADAPANTEVDGYPFWDDVTYTFYIYQDGAVRAQASRAWVSGLYAPLASAALTGVPTAPTAAGGTNTTQIATTAFVTTASATNANLTGPITSVGNATTIASLATGTGLPVATGISGLGTGVAAWMADPTSAKLATTLTGETGTAGGVMFSVSPTTTGTLTASVINASGAVAVASGLTVGPGTPTAYSGGDISVSRGDGSGAIAMGNGTGSLYYSGTTLYIGASAQTVFGSIYGATYGGLAAAAGTTTLDNVGMARLFQYSNAAALVNMITSDAASYINSGYGLIIGGGSAILKVMSATATLNFGNTAAQSSADLTITVTGAAIGDSVELGIPAAPDANACFTAWVSATNTVTVRFNNYSAAAIDPASATYRATVTHF